jgi:hypothetical protein
MQNDPICLRCLGTAMFRPRHQDRQSDTWMCRSCDAPERWQDVETREFPKPAKAALIAALLPGLPVPAAPSTTAVRGA